VVDDFPRTANGKIQRASLRAKPAIPASRTA
jgi:acyl-coenzyme A synthetase/AMP-(fatty) acid ligase